MNSAPGENAETADARATNKSTSIGHLAIGFLKIAAIGHLKLAASYIELLEPVASSEPGPLQSEEGRAYQALSLTKNAISWLEKVNEPTSGTRA